MSVYVIKLVRSAPRSGSIINYLGTTISPFGRAFLLQGGLSHVDSTFFKHARIGARRAWRCCFFDFPQFLQEAPDQLLAK